MEHGLRFPALLPRVDEQQHTRLGGAGEDFLTLRIVRDDGGECELEEEALEVLLRRGKYECAGFYLSVVIYWVDYIMICIYICILYIMLCIYNDIYDRYIYNVYI